MRELFIGIGILFLFLLICTLIDVIWTAAVRRKVQRMDDGIKEKRLDDAIRPFGFLYDPQQDVFYSRMYPWQRNVGYERAFDEGAVLLSMVIDCEPIYFEYGRKIWLIEFWKGQYGMTTGAEVGVYCTQKPENYKSGDERKLHYDSAGDDERLYMQFIVYKDGEEILRRRAEHWWLTAFEPGMYSKPEELSMCVKIGFLSETMANAFFRSLIEIGYRGKDAYISGRFVSIYFTQPKTEQPTRGYRLLRVMAQANNRRNCKLYKRRTRGFGRDLDKITFLSFRYPLLYRAILGFRGWRGIKKVRNVRTKV